MSTIIKIVAVLIVLAVVYFVVTGQPSISVLGNSTALSQIDSQYAVGPEKLAPLDSAKIAEYEIALRKLNPANENEKNTIEMKLELARMQDSMLTLSENYPKINFNNVECSAAGPLGLSDSAANSALEHSKNALSLQAKITAVQGQEYLTSTGVKSALTFSSGSLEETVQTLDYFCGK